MHRSVVAHAVLLASWMMLSGSCTVGPSDSYLSFGGPASASGPSGPGGPGGSDAASTGHDEGTTAVVTGTSAQGSTTGPGADETNGSQSSTTMPGGSTSNGSNGGESTSNATTVGTTGEPMCDAFCNGCACPGNNCTMCCAGMGKVDQCVGGSCFCF